MGRLRRYELRVSNCFSSISLARGGQKNIAVHILLCYIYTRSQLTFVTSAPHPHTTRFFFGVSCGIADILSENCFVKEENYKVGSHDRWAA